MPKKSKSAKLRKKVKGKGQSCLRRVNQLVISRSKGCLKLVFVFIIITWVASG